MEAFGKPPYLGNVSEGPQDVNIITLLFFFGTKFLPYIQ